MSCTISVTDLKRDSDVLGRVQHAHERVTVCRNGREAFAVVPMADLELLEALEGFVDLKLALERLRSWKDEDGVPLDDALEQLGL